MKNIFLLFTGFILLSSLTSCKKDRLEDYFVKASENPDFFVMSLPASAIEIDKSKLDKETLSQIESVKKINLLLYKKEDAKNTENEEYKKVEEILNHPDYKKLLEIKNEGRQLEFLYQGEPQSIHKITFLGRDANGDFVLGLVKAKHLSIDALVKAMEHVKRVDNHHITEFIDTYGKHSKKIK